MTNEIMLGQRLVIKRVAKIFLNPLAEKGLEGEAILIEKIKSIHLEDQLYWEKWKVRFLGDGEEEEEIVERNILAMHELL